MMAKKYQVLTFVEFLMATHATFTCAAFCLEAICENSNKNASLYCLKQNFSNDKSYLKETMTLVCFDNLNVSVYSKHQKTFKTNQ